MSDPGEDKLTEKLRYDSRATLLQSERYDGITSGAAGIPPHLRAPYLAYEHEIALRLPDSAAILEVAAGFGQFTRQLIDSGKIICATDISVNSLNVLRGRYAGSSNLQTVVCDIEQLSFCRDTFDIVVSAGGLSYGDSEIVMREIFRVLKPEGYFICVDSLNENPIYRINRYIHYLRGLRSRSTLIRMPTRKILNMYRSCFGDTKIHFFGGFVWLAPLLLRFMGSRKTSSALDYLDHFFRVKMIAFKFVMVARKGSK